MPFDPATYDDQRELTRYVFRNFHHLFTELEWLADRAVVAEFKAQHASDNMARTLRNKWGEAGKPEVAPLLADGPDAFRSRVTNRIVSECSDELFINRCAECDSVVATPKARQCLWCGHDWN